MWVRVQGWIYKRLRTEEQVEAGALVGSSYGNHPLPRVGSSKGGDREEGPRNSG